MPQQDPKAESSRSREQLIKEDIAEKALNLRLLPAHDEKKRQPLGSALQRREPYHLN